MEQASNARRGLVFCDEGGAGHRRGAKHAEGNAALDPGTFEKADLVLGSQSGSEPADSSSASEAERVLGSQIGSSSEAE